MKRFSGTLALGRTLGTTLIAATQPVTHGAAVQLANPMVALRLMIVVGMLALGISAMSKSESSLLSEPPAHAPQ